MLSKIDAGTEHLIASVVNTFGLKVIEYLPAQKGYRNASNPVRLLGGGIVNVMLFRGDTNAVRTIQHANRVSNFLAEAGLPARKTYDDRILSISSASNQRYAALYNFLPGETIAWEAYTQKHIKLLGKTMGDMHQALLDFNAGELPDVEEIYLQIVSRMEWYFRQKGVTQAMELKLGLQFDTDGLKKYEILLEHAKLLKNRQALHMDFVRGNILFMDSEAGPEVSGILDFEKTAVGNPLFDIARTLAFLLVDCKYKSAESVRKYFLYSGYQKRSAARLPKVNIKFGTGQASLLEPLIDLFLTYDLYKFLRHNPYEFLDKNEHFVRTRDMLLRRNVIFLANNADK